MFGIFYADSNSGMPDFLLNSVITCYEIQKNFQLGWKYVKFPSLLRIYGLCETCDREANMNLNLARRMSALL